MMMFLVADFGFESFEGEIVSWTDACGSKWPSWAPFSPAPGRQLVL